METEEEPTTQRTCEACGGAGCNWCTEGFMNINQFSKWRDFRKRMRNISGTYSMLESIVDNLIQELTKIGHEETLREAQKASIDLRVYLNAEINSKERNNAAMDLISFQRTAIKLIAKHSKRFSSHPPSNPVRKL